MFRQGQQIIYGGNGVCTIEEIVSRESVVSGESGQVYVIRLSSGLTSYIPVGSSVFMRALISEEEAKQVLADFPEIAPRTFAGTNSKALADQYRAIIGRHVPRELLCLYKSLQNKIEQARLAGKKPGTMDERFASSALDHILQEFSVVLDCTADDILRSLGIEQAR